MILTVVTIGADLRWRRIPNAVTYPAMALGLAFGALEGVPGRIGEFGFLDHLTALLLAFALVYPIYVLRLGMGAGDAKFLMALGAVRGVGFFIPAALYGSALGGVLALILIVLKRLDPPETEQAGRLRHVMKSRIPYGVALGVGALLALAVAP